MARGCSLALLIWLLALQGTGAVGHEKVAAIPPTVSLNTFTIAGSIDATNIPVLAWQETLPGDGDNNGEVNISDLSPLGASFGQTPDPEDPAHSVARDADYDGNGEVNISDLSPMGANFGVTLGGYAILAGPDETSLTELVRVDRTVMFNPSPSISDGELFWEWIGEAITADTWFAVQPYDLAGELGLRSENALLLEYTPPNLNIVTDIQSISFTAPQGESSSWPTQGEAYTILLSELSVDGTVGNAETFATEYLDLSATFELDNDPGKTVDAGDRIVWYITSGAGLLTVSNAPGELGHVTFLNRGEAVIEGVVKGKPSIHHEITLRLLSIEQVSLSMLGGGTGPIAIGDNDQASFEVLGSFDWDGLNNGNEVDQDISAYCAWGSRYEPVGAPPGELPYSLDPFAATLDTGTVATGDKVFVSCSYPPGALVTLYDNLHRTSNEIQFEVF